MTEAARVLVADDQELMRSVLRSTLAKAGFEVVAEAGDAAEAVRLAHEHQPDLCVIDIHMPGSGVDAAAAIHRDLPGTRIVMLTASEATEDLMQAVRAGASGYLLKDTDPGRLPQALRGVLRGEAAIPRTLVATLVDELRREENQRPEKGPSAPALSGREWEVVEGLRSSETTKQIAARLGISDVTVRRHISSIVGKLGAEDRSDALRLLAKRRPRAPGT